MRKILFAAISTVLIAIVGGCDTNDERAVKLATESAQRQAEQNEVVADLGRKMSDNQRRMVESVAQSRTELVALQQEVAEQRRQLDQERKEAAQDRRTESVLAVLLAPAGWLALAALPLVLCWLILSDLTKTRSQDAEICQLLVDELMPAVTEKLPGPRSDSPRINHDPATQANPPEQPMPF